MVDLFQSTSINRMSLSNRFVRSATWEGMADEHGAVTPNLIRLMTELARGGVGLIITSHAFVRFDGQAGPWQLGICNRKHSAGLRELVNAVHQENGKIVIQLTHAGCKAAKHLTGKSLCGPSHINHSKNPCKQLSVQDIRQMADDFSRAASQACEAGFDGVQLHAAHCYLFSQFLSPYYNYRTDLYGGNSNNRARALMETLESVRREVGAEIPILAKINADDTLPTGVRPGDMVNTALQLEQGGIDAIELSGGCKDGVHLPARKGKIDSPEKEVFYREAARLYKEKIKVPLILVGGIRSFETAEGLIYDGLADYVSMSRPFICEPDLVNRWKTGDRRPSACLSDNLCYGPIRNGQGVRCAVRFP